MMKEIIELASREKIGNIKNFIVSRSLQSGVKEDRTIKIITKEVAEFLLILFDRKQEK